MSPDQARLDEESLPRMSFGDHLDELRRRLLICLIAIGASMLLVMPFKDSVTGLYMRPYRVMWDMSYRAYLEQLEESVTEAGGLESVHARMRQIVEWNRENAGEVLSGDWPSMGDVVTFGSFHVPYTLKSITPLQDFWVFMGAAILFALILASPVVVHQIWSFVAAGLYRHERRVVMRYVPFGMVLLLAGVLFGYGVVVPFGMFFLVGMMNPEQVGAFFSVSDYFSFLFTLTVALGLVFQLPLLMLAMTKIGLVSHTWFVQNWRYVVLGFFAVSAMLTPPDPFTQILMAVPMLCLYGLGLFLTWRASRTSPTEPDPDPAAAP